MPSRSSLAQCPAKRTSPLEIAEPISRESTRILQRRFAFFLSVTTRVQAVRVWPERAVHSVAHQHQKRLSQESFIRPSHVQSGVSL
jgi:hypothetical protein